MQRFVCALLTVLLVLSCARPCVAEVSDELKKWRENVRLHPDDAVAHNNLGVIYGILGQQEDAVAEFREAVRRKPDYTEAHNNLGTLYNILGRQQEAVAEFKQAIRLKPDYTEAHNNLGTLYNTLGQHKEALAEYKEAIRLKPDYAEAHLYLGALYIDKLGRHVEAIAEYKEAIRLNPDFVEAHLYLAELYAHLGRHWEAVAEFKEVIRLKPDHTEAHNRLVEHVSLERQAEALAEYKESVRTKPNDAQAHMDLGMIYDNQGRYEEAITGYKEAVRISPNVLETHNRLLALYTKLSRHEEAIAEYKDVFRLHPNDAYSHNNLGVIYSILGRHQEAVAEFKEAIRLKPDYSEAHNRLVSLYIKYGRHEEAIAEYKDILRSDVLNEAQVNIYLGTLYERLGRREEAIAEYKEALRRQPNEAQVHTTLGTLYQGLSRHEEAIAEYKEAVRIKPDNYEWHITLGEVYDKVGRSQEADAEYKEALRIQGKEGGNRNEHVDAYHEFLENLSLAPIILSKTMVPVQILFISAILAVFLFLLIKILNRSRDFKQNSSSDHQAYRPDIDGLRAIAVLSVVAFHAHWRGMPGGFSGVDVFFVISGYLISGILFKKLATGTFSFFDFYSRRIKRIFPALAAMLFAVWGAGWLVLLADEYKLLGKHIVSSAAFLQNFTLWQEAGYFDTAADLKPLLHLWSLGVEEQYYILWPFALYCCWRTKINPFALLIVVGAGSFALNAGLIGNHAMATFYLPHTRFWELMLGGALAYGEIYPNPTPQPFFGYSNLKAGLGFSLITAAVLFLDKSKVYPGWWALIPVTGAYLLIAAGREAWINRKILANPALVFIGLISYPLYIWHWPLLSLVRIKFNAPPPEVEIAAIVAALFLSWATYEFLEKPVRFGKFSRGTKAPAVLMIIIVGAGLLGVETYWKSGFISRFPEAVSHLTNYPGEPSLCIRNKEEYCIDSNKNNPLVVLWGDSVSDSLAPGLKHLKNTQNYRLAQFNKSGCPAALNLKEETEPACIDRNNFTVKKIIELKAQTVILAGWWAQYSQELLEKRIEETTDYLKKSGVSTIVLIGPSPVWHPTLPKALFFKYRADQLHRLPERMWSGLDNSIHIIDQYMHTKADRLGIIYVSPFTELCNAEGCLTRVGDKPEDLLMYDSIHYTASGARFFINKVFANLSLV